MMLFLERVARGGCLVADGAMGTMLQERGLKPGECPEILNLTKPEILVDIARRYFEAGASIIQTNTFGASPVKLAEFGLDQKTEEINRRSVEIVKSVVGDRAYISGSCGPSGKLLEPYGDTKASTIRESYQRQVRSLIDAGVGIICVETMTDLREAVIAVEAARSVASYIPIMATMTFDETPRGFFTIMGVSIPKAAEALAKAGANVIGSNCGNGIENMVTIAREFRKVASLPLLIQSNAGRPQLCDGRLVYSETPRLFRKKTEELLEIGINIIGGCCGTTPDHIRAIKMTVDRRM